MLKLKKKFILQNNHYYMKNFIHCLIITIVLLSCKKKEEIAPKPISKNLGVWVGYFDGEKTKTTIEITKQQLIFNNLYFTIMDLNDYKIKTGLCLDKTKYITYFESDHYFSRDTLFVNFSVSDNTFKQGKFVK